MTARPVPAGELVRWSESLAAIARTGLAFTASAFEAERYHEILRVAADIRAAVDTELANGGHGAVHDVADLVEEWMRDVGSGPAGYQTPRVAIGAIVGNDAGELLLIQRADSGVWLYPTGWADVGYSAAEIAVKEVSEETGLTVEPVRLAMVLDGLRLGMSGTALYSLVFHCRLIGGEIEPHPLETTGVGFFSRENLPTPLAGAARWADHAFEILAGTTTEVIFDGPRHSPWRA